MPVPLRSVHSPNVYGTLPSPVADRACVKIAMASMTFGHHELPAGGEPSWLSVTLKM